MFADGDFTTPSVYLGEEEGERLAVCAGREVALMIGAERLPVRGCNVVARSAGRFDEVMLGINLDGAGYREGATAYSLYGSPMAWRTPSGRRSSRSPGWRRARPGTRATTGSS